MDSMIGPCRQRAATPAVARPPVRSSGQSAKANGFKMPPEDLVPSPAGTPASHDELEALSRAEAEVPDHYTVVRGGAKPLPEPGTTFSCAAGIDKMDAAKGVPHGTIRVTTARAIRAYEGQARFKPEPSKNDVMNLRHVDVREGRPGAFGEPEPNPVPKQDRIA